MNTNIYFYEWKSYTDMNYFVSLCGSSDWIVLQKLLIMSYHCKTKV